MVATAISGPAQVYITLSASRAMELPTTFTIPRTFATLALQNGVDVKTVSGMLGHFSAGFTLDTYAHVTTAYQRQAAKTMGSILSGSLQP